MYYNEKTIIFLDGKWIKASEANTDLYSQTLHYGTGVFEGIRSYNTPSGAAIFKAKEHYERLQYSAEKMHIPFDFSVDEMTAISYDLLKKNNLTDAYIRPLVYLGANMSLSFTDTSHFMLCAWEWGKLLGDKQLKLMTSSFQRPNPKSCFVEAKVTGHYTNSILASSEAKANGYDEALLLDMHHNVAEGPGANFFYEKDGILFTAPLGNILNGITRQTIFELGEQLGVSIIEKHFTKEAVYDADSAFFTGTAAEVAPIQSLDGHEFGLPWEDSWGSKLSSAYQTLIRNKQ